MAKLLVLLLAFVSLCSWADTNSTYATLNPQAKAQWLRLLGFDNTHRSADYQHSAIISDEFFLHPNGRHDPQAELQASLDAFKSPVIDPDEHAQCRFRGRYLWLKQHLPMTAAPTVNCAKFEEWIGGSGEVESISFVLVSGNLGNPASFYGHTLIKIQPKTDSVQSHLKDPSVNFGAIVPDNASMPGYIWNTITGGYEGGFTHDQYYYHTHNYGERQLRDLWEYELDLSDAEAEIIAGHAWELLGKKYQYFFLHRNCAFRMAHLLELADGVDIVDPDAPWHIPQRLTQSMMTATRSGKPLVRKVSHQPSRQSRLSARLDGLSESEKTAFEEQLQEGSSLEGHYQSLPSQNKAAVIDALMDTYRYRVIIDEEHATDHEQHYLAALTERYQLPAIANRPLNLPNEPPHTSRLPGYTSLGLRHYTDDESGLSLRFRPAYYDALDSDHGHLAFSELSMGSLSIEARENRLLLQQVEIVRATHNPINQTGLDGESRRSWAMGLGWYGLDPECSGGCAVPTAWAEGGVGREFSQWGYLAVRGGIGIRENRLERGHLYAYPKIQFIAKLGERWRVSSSISHRESLDTNFSQTRSKLALRRSLGLNHDVRLYWEKGFGESVGLSYGWYW